MTTGSSVALPNETALRSQRIAGTLTTTMAVQALGLVSGALAARLLGVDGRGLLAALILWPTVSAHLGDLGGPIANAYMSARKPEKAPVLIWNSLIVCLVQSAILCVITLPIMMAALGKYRIEAWVAVGFVLTYIPFNLLYRYLNFINQGLRFFTAFNLARLAVQAGYTAAVLALFLFRDADIRLVLGAYAFSHLIAALIAGREVFSKVRPKLEIGGSLLREGFSYGIRAHLGNLTPIELLQLDLAVVVIMLGPHDAGLYSVAASAGLVIRMLGGSMGSVALPSVAAATGRSGQNRQATEIFRFAILLTCLIASFIAIAASPLVVAVYGSAFLGAVPIIRILCIAMVAAALRQVLGDCLRGAGRPLQATISEVASWGVTVAGLGLLVSAEGAIGAAVAVSIGYCTAFALSLYFMNRIGVRISELIPRRSDVRSALEVVSALSDAVHLAVRRPEPV